MGVFELARIDVCLLTIRMQSKSSFNMGMFEFAKIIIHLLVIWMQPKSFICWYMHSRWTKNNTLELPKKFNTQKPIVDVIYENINHVIQTMQFTYGLLISINFI